MSLKSRAQPLEVWDELGGAVPPADGPLASSQRRSRGSGAGAARRGQAPPPPPAGSPAAQEWLAALARWCEGAEGARAKAGLTELLRCGARSRDKVAAVANRARQEIGKVFSWAPAAADAAAGGAASPDAPQRARQCQYLFERVLHGVLLEALQCEAEGGEAAEGAAPTSGGGGGGGSGGPDGRRIGPAAAAAALAAGTRDRVVEEVLADEQSQLGLVNACIEVVHYAYLAHPSTAFPWATLQLGRIHSCLELWQACDWVADHMDLPPEGAEGAVPGMPECVGEYLAAMMVRIEEELAFIDSSSIYARIVTMGASWSKGGSDDAPASSGGKRRTGRASGGRRSGGQPGAAARQGPEGALVARFLSNLARTAMFRTHTLCQVLLEEFPAVQAICPELGSRVCFVVDLLLTSHLELLFGQHLSVAIACAVYYTVRLHGEALPFRKITALMAQRLPNHDEATFQRVELPAGDGAWDPSERDHGDTRAWYNRVFLPAFLQYRAEELFGEGMAPTPEKAQLEDSEPAAAAATGQAADATAAPLPLPVPLPVHAAAAAGAAASGPGGKQQRAARRPLGQLAPNRSGPAGLLR